MEALLDTMRRQPSQQHSTRHALKESVMLAVTKRVIAIFVDRSLQQWIVRDPDGNYWIVPSGDDAWERRQPFELTENSELEPVPGHYKYLLRLPF